MQLSRRSGVCDLADYTAIGRQHELMVWVKHRLGDDGLNRRTRRCCCRTDLTGESCVKRGIRSRLSAHKTKLSGKVRRRPEIEWRFEIRIESRPWLEILPAIGKLCEQELLDAIDPARRLDLGHRVVECILHLLLRAIGSLCCRIFLIRGGA